MSKHRAHRVGTHRWPVFLGVCALMLGGISLLVINSAASAHCTPVLSDCDHHRPVETTDTTTSDPPTESTTEITTTSSTTSATTSTTTRPRPPAPTYDPPTYDPPTGDGTGPASTSGSNSGQSPTRPPGQLPTPRPQTPTPDTTEDTGLAPPGPPSGGGTGSGPGGGGTGNGTAGGEFTADSVPTAPPASSIPTEAVPPTPSPSAGTGNPVMTAVDPVSTSAQCLLGADESGGCAGAETARDLAPAGLLILGALALLGSGSFLESLRGSLRG